MDQERLTPPSPTAADIREVKRLAEIYASCYDSQRAQGMAEICGWVLGERDRPAFPDSLKPKARRP